MLKGMFLDKLNTESRTVNNAVIQLGDIDDSGKGRKFISKFIQPGLVKIEGHGIVLLRKETLDASLPTIVGSPVIIQHKDVTEENADELRCGVIANAYFNEPDGWYYVDGIIWDDKAQELINKGWSVSCSYDYLAFNDEGGEENNIHYDKEFTQLNFTHLAIVNNPRYERANIVFNCKIDNESEQKGKWVTIKGNHIFIPDGKTLDEVIDEKWEQRTKSYKEAKDHAIKQLELVERKLKEKNSPKKQEELVSDKKELEDRIKYYEEQDEKQERKKTLKDNVSSRDFAKFLTDKKLSLAKYEDFETNKKFPKMLKDYFNLDEEPSKKDISELFDGPYVTYLDKSHPDYVEQKTKGKKSDKSSEEAKQQQKDKPSKLSDIDKELLQQGNTYSFARLLVENYPKEAKEAGINSYVNDYKKIDFDKDNKEYILYYDNGDKAFFSTDFKCKGYKTYNSKENDMTLIDKLQELINSVKNNKENETMVENAKVDKRKLIDEVAGIMKSAGCDDELIRTAIGKMEKIGYDDSEKSADNEKEEDKKADNVKEDDKEGVKKVDNEDAKDKKEAEDLKKDAKEDVENKCKNSVENSKDEGKAFFDRINAIYNSSKKIEEPDTPSYESRESRLEEGKKYFS